MEVALAIETVLSTLRSQDILACVIGEIALNYYNVPRVVHDIEICVTRSLLSKAVSSLRSTGLYELTENNEYDIFTEYKKGFPRLAVTNSNLQVVIFPDSHFFLSPLGSNIVSYTEIPFTTYSREIQDVVPVDKIRLLPMPRLPPYFIALSRRFFESNDYMARIAAEQLVDGMHLDEEWVGINLSDAPHQVRELATRLVAERSSRYDDGCLHLEELDSTVGRDGVGNLRLIPGSGY